MTYPLYIPKMCYLALHRDGHKGFGFHMKRGSNFGGLSFVVDSIPYDGPAARNGWLQVGDEIFSIDQYKIMSYSSRKINDILQARDEITMMTASTKFNIVTIELLKPELGELGLLLCDHKPFPGVYVEEVIKGTVADLSKQVKAGDRLLSVNKEDVADATKDYVSNLLQSCTGQVSLTVKHPLTTTDDEESKAFCASIEKHLRKSGAVNRYLAHIVFVGPPGSGKTTLIARLLDLEEVEEMLRACASTGIMDGVVTVNVMEDEASVHAATVEGNCEWQKVEFGLSCLRQMGVKFFVSNQNVPMVISRRQATKGEAASVSTKSPGNSSFIGSQKLQIYRKMVTKQARMQAPQNVMASIEELLNKEGFPSVRQFLDNKSSLYLSDTVDLDERVSVSYRKKVGDKVKHSNVYTSSLTIRESFLQTLASIDSMEGNSNPSIAKHKPYVFVVGTHKDCLVNKLGKIEAEQKIAEIDGKMKCLINEHNYNNLVVYANKAEGQVLFAVDNTCKNDVFLKIRQSIMSLIYSSDDFRIRFPLSYLLASLHLQNINKPFIKRSEFAKDVLQYGIEDEDIDHLLQFLHTRIGQIRHFRLEEIREIIVNQPQALYNLVTHLLIKSFLSQSNTIKECSEIQRGIYSLESFNDPEFFIHSEFLTPKQVINLLKELRIVAPFFDRAAGVEKYFIPCVLNHLTESPIEDSCKMSIVQPLAIMFECGHCPKGMFGVLLHYILTHKVKQFNWHLDINKIKRDQVSFEVGPYEDVVSVKFHTTYLEVRCSPVSTTQRSEAFTLKKVCNMIHSTLVSGIKQATKSLNYSSVKTKHSPGLVCTECSKVHKVTEIDSQYVMRCPTLNEGHRPLPDPGTFWFGAPPSFRFPNSLISLCEGSDHVFTFDVISDPSLDTQSVLTLSKQRGSPNKHHVYLQGRTLHFNNIRKSDAGMYTVSSSNAAGRGEASFQLTIMMYVLETDYLEAHAGECPTLAFNVISDPPLAEDTKHTLTKRGGEEVTKRFKVENNCITFRNVTVQDSGTYTISCCNGRLKATLELDVAPLQPRTLSHGYRVTLVRDCDVNILMSQLHKYGHRWEDIGMALKFEHSELENIRHSNPRATAQQLLLKLLSQWCQWPTDDHRDIPTLESLQDGLRSGLVGLGAVADQLNLHQ